MAKAKALLRQLSLTFVHSVGQTQSTFTEVSDTELYTVGAWISFWLLNAVHPNPSPLLVGVGAHHPLQTWLLVAERLNRPDPL